MGKHQSHFLSNIITGLLGLSGFALILAAGGIFYASLDLFGTELGFTLVLVSAIFLVGGAIMLALVVLSVKIQALTLRLQPFPKPTAPIEPSLANIVATPPVLFNPVPIKPVQADDGAVQKEQPDEAAQALPDRKSLDDKIATELAKLAKTAAPTLPLVTNKVDVTNLDNAGEAASLLPTFMRTRGQSEHKNEPERVQEPIKEPLHEPAKEPIKTPPSVMVDKPELAITQEPSLQPEPDTKDNAVAKPALSAPPIAPDIAPTIAPPVPSEPSLEDMSFEEKLARLANISLPAPAPTPDLAPEPSQEKALPETKPIAATPIATDADADKETPQDTEKDAAKPDNAPKIVGEYHSAGTHYLMFSDGSIEAQSQAGVFRFASMDDLRAFIAEQSKGA